VEYFVSIILNRNPVTKFCWMLSYSYCNCFITYWQP